MVDSYIMRVNAMKLPRLAAHPQKSGKCEIWEIFAICKSRIQTQILSKTSKTQRFIPVEVQLTTT